MILEMDSRLVYAALNNHSSFPSHFELLVEDCKALAHSNPHVIFNFAQRSTNSTAHVMARAACACSMSDLQVWEETPLDFVCIITCYSQK